MPEQNQKRKAVRVRSLRQRWILNSVVPVFALLALIVAGVSLGISNYYYQGMLDGLERQARAQSGAFVDYFMDQGFANYLQRANQAISDYADKERVEMQFLSSAGSIQASSTSNLTVGTRPGTDDIARAVEQNRICYFRGADPKTGEQILAVSHPLTVNGKVVGVLRFVTSLRQATVQVRLSVLAVCVVAALCLLMVIRSNRGVTLTPEGEMLYSRIASAAVQIQDAEEELSASATLEHGTISISATETALNIYLSKKLRDFHTEYPGIRLRISNHSTPQAVQAVKNGEVDFAIVSTPAEIESGLKMVELKPFYEVLVGGRTFTALASQSLTLKELRSYPLISLSDESVTRSLYRQFFLDHGAVLKPDTEAATTDQMLTLVKSELGLAFVPEPMARDSLERGELVQLHLQEIIPTRSICLVYDRHRPLNTAARKFQQMLTKADPPRPAASKQTESISFVSQ